MLRYDPELEAELVRLAGLDLHGLRDAWAQHLGPPPKLRSPGRLRHMLAWRLQVNAYGDLDAETRRLLAKGTPKRNGPEAKPGVRLVREWKGQRHEAEVTDDGVLYRGQRYASLSEVARAITGTRWNGPRFFGLRGGA